jgi:hypothetical protein
MVAALSICATAVATDAAGAATGQAHVSLHLAGGHFTSPALNITDPVVDGSIVHYNLSGGDHWTGTLDGNTTYSGSGTIDLVSGAITATVFETFTGTMRGVGTGHLHSVDTIKSDGVHMPTVDCLVVNGDGALTGTVGFLHFAETSVTNADAYGNGDAAGYYIGFLVTRGHA